MDRKLFGCILLSALLMLAGCFSQSTPAGPAAASDVSIQEVVDKAEPDKAVNEIYDAVDISGVYTGDLSFITDNLLLSLSDITGYSIRYSSGDFGLADVIIIRPADGKKDAVRTALLNYQTKRISQCKDYDILDSYATAQNGVVYTQGDYEVLLMLADTAAAQKIIDSYIPR